MKVTIVEYNIFDMINSIQTINEKIQNLYITQNCKIVDHRLKRIHQRMIERCYKNHIKSKKHYQNKNIVVCQDWLISIDNFKRWAIKNNYKIGLTIDRIDSSSNYCPNNCRFITKQENSSRVKYKNSTPFDAML